MLERMWSKWNTPPLLVGVQICTATLKINVAFSQKIDTLPQDPAITLLRIIPKDTLPYQKDVCSTMFIAVIFILTRNNLNIPQLKNG